MLYRTSLLLLQSPVSEDGPQSIPRGLWRGSGDGGAHQIMAHQSSRSPTDGL